MVTDYLFKVALLQVEKNLHKAFLNTVEKHEVVNKNKNLILIFL